MSSTLGFFTQNCKTRMAMNIVEGYVVNPDNEWCKPFALGEVNYSNKVLKVKG